MGWAERHNVNATAKRAGALAAKAKPQREHFKRPDFKALWARFDERLGIKAGRTGKVTIRRFTADG